MNFILGFIVGLVIGGSIGALAMALFAVGKKNDNSKE